MATKSRSYKKLLDDVIDPRVTREASEVFFALTLHCARTATKRAQRDKRKIKVIADPKAIYETLKSAYDDIKRYKVYHIEDPRNQKSDAVKRAAYFTKWILRRRPIVVIDSERVDDPEIPNYDIYAVLNEELAIQWGLLCIAQDHRCKDIFLREKHHGELIYHLRFRELSTDGLLLAFQLLHKVAATRKDNDLFEFRL